MVPKSPRALVVCAFTILVGLGTFAALNATSIPTGSATTQPFDSIGTSATATLPTDFKVDRLSAARTVGTFSTADPATTQAGGANLSSSASNGIYNFGAGTTTTGSSDRAIGFLSSGSATVSGNLYTKLTNGSGAALTALQIGYAVEKYRGGSNPAGFRVQMFYSTDGAAWTSAGNAFLTAFAADGSNSGFATAPGASTAVNNTLTVAIAAGSDFYLAWNYSVATGSTSSNAQALAIDDISILGLTGAAPTTNPSGTGSANPTSVMAGDSTLLRVVTAQGANPTSTGVAVTANLAAIGGSATQTFFDDGSNGDVTAGDGTFSYTATVSAATAAGSPSLAFTVSDAQGRSSGGTIALAVVTPAPDGVVISRVYGGGGNNGALFTHDFIELHNRTIAAVNLATWSVQYASVDGGTWQVTPLTGTIPAGGYLLIQEASQSATGAPLPAADVTGSIAMSASSGKVALANTTAPLTGTCPATSPFVADFVGYGGANCFEGAGAAPGLSATTAATRLANGATDTDDNAADFTAATPVAHNTQGIPPAGVTAALPQSVPSGGTSLLTVAVTPGSLPANTAITVTADLTAIGGGVSTPFFDNGTNGDVTANDKIFSLSTTVTGTSGAKAIPATIADTVPRSTAVTIRVAVETAPSAIHDIQGDGARSSSDGLFVTTTGIVTAVKSNGVFIQTSDGDTDSTDTTSEGLFVFTGSTPAAVAAIGSEVVVSGTIQEFAPGGLSSGNPPITELVSPFFRAVASAQPLPAPVTLPSHTALEQLERFEGMRVRANIQAIAPTDGFVTEEIARSTSNGLFYAVVQGTARPMREPGLEPGQALPTGAPATIARFDGNPERLRVDSNAQLTAPAIEIAAGQTIADLTGVLDFSFGAWTLLPDPADANGAPWVPSGAAAAAPVPTATPGEFTVAHLNLERFFDDRDDPDFPPANEPVLTASALDDRLAKASLAIRQVLGSPDIIGVIEVENLEVLERLAARISADTTAPDVDPRYDAYLLTGNDVGSIDIGLLVKRDRINVIDHFQIGKDTTYTQPGGGTALLNDRPSLVLEAELTGLMLGPGGGFRVTVIVNHLRSMSGIDGSSGARIRAKRRAQAEFLASYIQQRQALDPAARIISLGDYNAFGFNDGYVDVMGTIKGSPAHASGVVLPSLDVVNPNLINLGDLLPPTERYSFTFDGNAQAIDHALVNAPLRRRFTRLAHGRIGADFPESLRNDPARPERLSDHDAVVAYFVFPGAPVVTLNGAATMQVEAYTGTFTDPGATAVDEGATADQNTPLPVTVTGSVNPMVPNTYTLTYTATNGFFTTTVERTVVVADTTAPSIQGFTLSPTSIWPPNHKMVDVTLTYTASDASKVATCTPVVTSSEAANAAGSGHTAVDTRVVDATHVQVRSERSGETRDRVYTVALTCGDAAGNTTTQSRQVRVFKNR